MHGSIRNIALDRTHKGAPRTAMVWDLPLRLFHWAMVCVVIIAVITGYLAPDSWQDIHVMAGYALGYLLVFRIIWGFLGSYYSRFSSFPLNIREVGRHLLSVLKANPELHTGHNPVGAWVIVFLLKLLTLLVLTGLVVLGGEEKLGPLASVTSYKVGDFTEDIHEALAGILIGAICIHLVGIFVEVKIFHHPILKAMISGHKPVATNYVEKRGPGFFRGALLFFIIAGVVYFTGMKLNALPVEGWRNVEFPPAYATECGDCHVPYHPSLLMADGWQTIMGTLGDHYGEDASLEEETRLKIERYLSANDALSFDTKVAHKMGRVETASNRMTDTRYWKRKHRKIKSVVFTYPSVGSKVNCNGCHKDAATGRFNDASIHIPNGDKK